jgi:hypothetical protein
MSFFSIIRNIETPFALDWYDPNGGGPPGEWSGNLVVCVLDILDRPWELKAHFESLHLAARDAGILTISLKGGLDSDEDPFHLAERLHRFLEEFHEGIRKERGGDRPSLTLVGLGFGALLARKAFAFARGEAQDTPAMKMEESRAWARWLSGDRQGRMGGKELPGERRPSWADSVRRMVFWGGMDLGWTPWPMRGAIPLYGPLAWRPLRRLGLPYVGRLAREAGPGTPFAVNLVVQWRNLERREALPGDIAFFRDGPDDEDGRAPDTRESPDAPDEPGPRFTRLYTPWALAFLTARAGRANWAAPPQKPRSWVDAMAHAVLGRPFPDPQLYPVRRTYPQVDLVVFVMHGIRDYGHWTGAVRRQLMDLAARGGRRVVALAPSYGYFPMLGFLLGFRRGRNVRFFMNRYAIARRKYPNARIGFIGHSNGTYLLAKALCPPEGYRACIFDRAAFAGSVVPRQYPWDYLVDRARILALRNDLAGADWVVAIFPRAFELAGELVGRPISDVGSGGFQGFLDPEGHANQVAYLRGAHGAGIAAGNHASLAEFVLGITPTPVVPASLLTRQPSRMVEWLSKLCWLVWALLLVGLAACAAGLCWAWQGHYGHPWLPLAVFALLVWLLLNTL